MKREDALFNWIQIQVVADARPHDHSAQETASFFSELLREDHQMSGLGYRQEGPWYIVYGQIAKEEWQGRYSTEAVESLLQAIESEPKYNA